MEHTFGSSLRELETRNYEDRLIPVMFNMKTEKLTLGRHMRQPVR